MNLNLDLIYPTLHDDARKAFDAGDIVGFFGYASSDYYLDLLIANAPAFKSAGRWEEAIVNAWTGSKYGGSDVMVGILCFDPDLDRKKLLAAGDPLPAQEQFRLYRGGDHSGISWTSDLEIAKFFGGREVGFLQFENPVTKRTEKISVYREKPGPPEIWETTVSRDEVYFYYSGRNESEYVIVPDDEIVRRFKAAA